jgi:hypothetical protein
MAAHDPLRLRIGVGDLREPQHHRVNQPPFAYAKKSSPGTTVRSMPAVSMFAWLVVGGVVAAP